ncbi:methyltransferase domain-containing protein [Streptomyces sp. NPDC019937]|uniref:methyltransferase domain-containing protein n=1 Tax=Streptomyces sp. NPDC019937 TaxID=3154787 RepID=UPI0033EFDD4E
MTGEPGVYWCQALAVGLVYGTDREMPYVLGTCRTVSPARALRWLRDTALHIADRLDPDPARSAWVRRTMRKVRVPVPDGPAELRVWAEEIEEPGAQRAARARIEGGEPLSVVVPDTGCRYTLSVWPLRAPATPPMAAMAAMDDRTERPNSMDWVRCAERLADQVTDPDSRWLAPVARVPRHELVPRWWDLDEAGRWVLRDGPSNPQVWADAAYEDRALVTRVGTLHADHAEPGERPEGEPTSSATPPGLAVRMLRHGRLGDGLSLLDLGTGAGGLTAYACLRLGDRRVTSLDVDPYVVSAAGERLAAMGHHPTMIVADAAEAVPGSYDRIVSTVALTPGPGLRAVVGALAPGGRIAAPLARTSLIVTGWKHRDGDVVGHVERDMAGFMPTRSGIHHPPAHAELFALARETDGEVIGTGRYPVVDVASAREVRSLLEVTTPGVELDYATDGRTRTAYLVHPDGSWARASAEDSEPPTVHQSGPRRLWDALERVRNRLNAEGGLPLLGARVRITPDGVCHLSRGRWRASMGA